MNVTGSTPNNYRYRGEQYDPDLNLYYLRARYFNPLTGRFLTRDPANGQTVDPRTLDRYVYAGGDPVARLDPSGRDWSTWFLIGTAMSLVVLIPVYAFKQCIDRVAKKMAVLRSGNVLGWSQEDERELQDACHEMMAEHEHTEGPMIP